MKGKKGGKITFENIKICVIWNDDAILGSIQIQGHQGNKQGVFVRN
jgi:hypothetical protein